MRRPLADEWADRSSTAAASVRRQSQLRCGFLQCGINLSDPVRHALRQRWAFFTVAIGDLGYPVFTCNVTVASDWKGLITRPRKTRVNPPKPAEAPNTASTTSFCSTTGTTHQKPAY